MRVLGAVCFSAAFVVATGAFAAELQSVQGDVTINQGQGFAPVNGRIDAQVGDSVMAGPNSSATVSYADGCQVSVQPGAVTTIAPISPCASGSYAQDFGNPFLNNPAFIISTMFGVGMAIGLGFGLSKKPTSP